MREEEMDGLSRRWEELSIWIPAEPGKAGSDIEEEQGVVESQRQ